ncbi:carboxypeptidase-like regulatory domain-containing protein [Mangrovivirga sp. M17]|uniref:Carboxypeptidase-like regulatory domain-containing protein n=1 Tax=Mangrovivirga halotolerans TaxID=2993936 RepID=A0ABT3RQR0_9BACT|nr:carboxypeptidase-like regulatory domain-containing protein [Mangrovivirga halotolerans]MCX2744125.1 carboxypeptidase-like regulatory domain-containing protein [Mangrovivirga halotolerans]
MKKQFNLSIDSPCSEKFQNFTPTTNGGFCQSCQKNVVDFTKMTEAEIIQYFNTTKSNTCGRFTSGQLKTYEFNSAQFKFPHFRWIGTGLLGLSLILAGTPALAKAKSASIIPVEVNQTVNTIDSHNRKVSIPGFTVNGTVTDEEGEMLPGVNVIIKGTNRGTVTDVNGKFSLQGIETGDVLIFSFVGYHSAEYKVENPSQAASIEIKIEPMEYELMGEVAVGKVFVSKPSLWDRIKSVFQ